MAYVSKTKVEVTLKCQHVVVFKIDPQPDETLYCVRCRKYFAIDSIDFIDSEGNKTKSRITLVRVSRPRWTRQIPKVPKGERGVSIECRDCRASVTGADRKGSQRKVDDHKYKKKHDIYFVE